MFFEKFGLAVAVAGVDFDGDIFTVGTDGFPGEDAGADGGLECNLEILARDDFFEFFGDGTTDGVGLGAVAHEGEGVDFIASDQIVDTDEVLGAVVGKFVVETGLARSSGF